MIHELYNIQSITLRKKLSKYEEEKENIIIWHVHARQAFPKRKKKNLYIKLLTFYCFITKS